MTDLPAVGETFADKYTIRELLGRGGNAAVFRATDVGVSRDVAVKIVLPSDEGYAPTVLGRFMREGRVLAGLVDPHNITMFDFGESDNGLLYMVFEYVDGRELGAFLKAQGPLAPAVVAHIVDQLLQGLEEAHQAGILHRDVKPANIMVYEYAGDPYRVKLLDFGIARPAATEAGPAVTSDGMVVGTPRYMSPEQLLGAELGPTTDLFSVGLVAYEMLVGRPAFDGESGRELRKQQFSPQPLRLPEGCAPPEFCRLIEAMISRDADQRPSSAHLVRKQMLRMKKALSHWTPMDVAATAPLSAVRAAEAPAPAPAPRRSRGYGRRFLMLAGIALAIGGALAFLILQAIEAPPPPNPVPREVANRLTRSSPAPDLVPAEAAVDTDVTPEPACGELTEPGLQYLSVDTAIGRRDWAVHVPSGYEGKTPLPVVMIFHRSLKSGDEMLQDTGLPSVADANDFFILAPTSSSDLPWQEQFREMDFLRLMVSATAEQYCLDLRHLYVIGEGRGGEFAEDIACALPISATALTVSGQGRSENLCPQSDRRTPRIRIYGELDRYVPSEGGRGCMLLGDEFLSATQVEEVWKERLGCAGKRQVWLDDRGGTCTTWNCEVPFVHCRTTGGHDWPDAPPDKVEFPGCDEPSPQRSPINYGETIWRFFTMSGRTLDDDAVKGWREGTL